MLLTNTDVIIIATTTTTIITSNNLDKRDIPATERLLESGEK